VGVIVTLQFPEFAVTEQVTVLFLILQILVRDNFPRVARITYVVPGAAANVAAIRLPLVATFTPAGVAGEVVTGAAD
jgi:hypothetical protein